jgi:hypothetical protein
VTVDIAAGLDDRDRGQRVAGDIRVQVDRVLDVRLHLLRMRHDGRVVLERVADVAVLVGVRAVGAVVQLVRIVDVVVPLVAVILPGDVLLVERVADAGDDEGGMVNGVLAGFWSMEAFLPLPK